MKSKTEPHKSTYPTFYLKPELGRDSYSIVMNSLRRPINPVDETRFLLAQHLREINIES